MLRQGLLRPASRSAASRASSDVAIIRVEQLYPFPHKQFAAEMKRYPNAKEVVWCQEEPQNQGAWYQTAHYFRENMRDDQKLFYAGRPPRPSPAAATRRCTTSSRRSWWSRRSESSSRSKEAAADVLHRQLVPARYALVFRNPGEA